MVSGNFELSLRKEESATVIPQGSRQQALPKRPAPLATKDDDMTCSTQECVAVLSRSPQRGVSLAKRREHKGFNSIDFGVLTLSTWDVN